MLEKIATVFLLFIIYSMMGWMTEVILVGIDKKQLVNRGFLLGPYCPIYGCGSILMMALLVKYKEDTITLFILAALICSVLEYITSYIMEKLYNARWWDYSNRKFNINGRICLVNSIWFGTLGVLLMKYINPYIMSKINMLNTTAIYIIALCVFGAFVLDICISFSVIGKVKEFAFEAKKDNTVEITKKVREMLKNKGGLTKRLLHAYPELISTIKSKREELEERKAKFIKRVREDIKNAKLEASENIKRFKIKK